MNKKVINFIFMLVLLLLLTGCGKKNVGEILEAKQVTENQKEESIFIEILDETNETNEEIIINNVETENLENTVINNSEYINTNTEQNNIEFENTITNEIMENVIEASNWPIELEEKFPNPNIANIEVRDTNEDISFLAESIEKDKVEEYIEKLKLKGFTNVESSNFQETIISYVAKNETNERVILNYLNKMLVVSFMKEPNV